MYSSPHSTLLTNEERAGLERSLRLMDRKVTRTIREGGLIRGGDRVLVALSGGKDSLVLLHLLATRRKWRQEQYHLHACHVTGDLGNWVPVEAGREGAGGGGGDGGFRWVSSAGEEGRVALLRDACHQLGVPLTVVECDSLSPDQIRDGKSPCFVCAWHRRKALFTEADRLGCGTVAFGHHKDDAAQTLLMNLFWLGRHETMLPRQVMFGGRITIIRPLIMVDEARISKLAGEWRFPTSTCLCGFAQKSNRQVAADVIDRLRDVGCDQVTGNLLRSVYQNGSYPVDGYPPRNRGGGGASG